MNVDEAYKLLDGIKEVDPEMPISQMMCLLVVSKSEDGMSLTDVSKKVGISLATASRYIGSLGRMNRHHKEGLNFVESFEDPMERRKKIIRLTTKGKIALKNILGE